LLLLLLHRLQALPSLFVRPVLRQEPAPFQIDRLKLLQLRMASLTLSVKGSGIQV